MTLKLHNTLTKTVQDFAPQTEGSVTLYTCGPTVYDYLHIGNWAAYIYWDTLVRTLTAGGYVVKRVMNITDVGHLVSDADEGQDKLEKGAEREGKTAWEIAQFYSDDFLAGMTKLNLRTPEYIARATDYIPEQIELIRTLKQKGHTYQISDGIYFDTSTFPSYADFAGLTIDAQKAGARVAFNSEKYNLSDFALWKFSPEGTQRDMEWETPSDLLEGDTPPLAPVMGFPGWHIECSAIAMNILGPTIDIHTGGIDHIPVHHTNEIAQSESASGQRFAHFWLHNNHLKSNGTKISKSLGNGYTLDDLKTHGFSPLDFRMLVLQGHYRSEGNFTLENLEAAHNRLQHWRAVAVLRWQIAEHTGALDQQLQQAEASILAALENDLDTPEALRITDDIFSRIESQPLGSASPETLLSLLTHLDALLGLQLVDATPDIDDSVKKILLSRESARERKDWTESDNLRDQLAVHGVHVSDTSSTSIWSYL